MKNANVSGQFFIILTLEKLYNVVINLVNDVITLVIRYSC